MLLLLTIRSEYDPFLESISCPMPLKIIFRIVLRLTLINAILFLSTMGKAMSPDPLRRIGMVSFTDLLDLLALRQELKTLIGQLPEKEQSVMSARFGLDGKSMSLEAVSKAFNIRRERIRQIEAQVLRKLQPARTDRMQRLHGLLVR